MSYNPLIQQYILDLVGQVSQEDLQHVDCYVSPYMGIFIPSTGHCAYAIRPEHSHPAYSFILFPAKDQCFADLASQFVPGYYLVEAMSPDVPHQEELSGGFKRYFALLICKEFFEAQYSKYFFDPPDTYNGETFLVDHAIMQNLKSFMAEYESGYPAREDVLAALALIITHKLIRSQNRVMDQSVGLVDEFSIDSVINYMNQHFAEAIDIAVLSRYANLSPSHFYRVFKKETGQPPMGYLNSIRLDKSRRLLRSGSSVTETALKCGFNSTSHFSASFSKHYNISPSQYRKNYLIHNT